MAGPSKTWFITGIARGVGREFAAQLLARGDRVIGTTRNGRSDLSGEDGQFDVRALDVTDGAAIRDVVNSVFAQGPIDVLVNNAGAALVGSVENTTDAEIDHVMAVNFHGPRRIIQAALPYLRRQRAGHIVNISSASGIAAGPAASLYAASKYALEGMTVGLAREVASYGIKVTAVELGTFRTEMMGESLSKDMAADIADYPDTVGVAIKHLANIAGRQPGDPAKAVPAMITVIEAPDPPLHFVLGPDAIARAETMLKAFATDIDTWRAVGMTTNHDDVA